MHVSITPSKIGILYSYSFICKKMCIFHDFKWSAILVQGWPLKNNSLEKTAAGLIWQRSEIVGLHLQKEVVYLCVADENYKNVYYE